MQCLPHHPSLTPSVSTARVREAWTKILVNNQNSEEERVESKDVTSISTNRHTLSCVRTLNDGQQDNNDEEEESDVKDDAVKLILVAIWGLNLVTNATTSPYSLVQVEHEALPKQTLNHLLLLCQSSTHRQHVMTLLVHYIILLRNIEFSEEVEGNDSVAVHYDGEQHASQDQLKEMEQKML
ncbi:hypothetical protein E2C01_004879 [Portunus trituberculatus]|uniref:Uncharacterized protein n=1 Tax=Portunus trituberculatus TaxID=210409 RepID=A0A5B7CR63_PORTR|nr:hypothetical protein [Portunus trituberculatus]